MATPVGTLGTIPTLTVAGRIYTDLTNLISLFSITNASYSTFVKDFDAGGYQVPGGQTLYISSLVINVRVAEALTGVNLGYGDNDVGFASGSAPTNAKFCGAHGVSNDFYRFANTTATGISSYSFGEIGIPTGKYPAIENIVATSGAGYCSVYGYLR